jgi:hypothetical protein
MFFRRKTMIAEAEQQQSRAEVIKAKLADCAAQIEGAEAELHRVSLDAAMSDDPQAGEQAIKRLQELRGRRELLEHAAAAEAEREADLRAEASLSDHIARRRAASQHCGRLEKHTKAVTQAQASLIAAYQEMIRASGALVATLPARMRTEAEPWHLMLNEAELGRMVAVEAHRLNRTKAGAQLFPRPASIGLIEREDGYTLPSLAERIAELTARVKAHFDATVPSAPKPAEPTEPSLPSVASPEVSASPAPEGLLLPVPLVLEPPRMVPSLEDGSVIDLRGRDLGVPKEPETAEEAIA